MHAVPSPVPRFACPSSRTSPRPCACDPSRLPILPSRRRQLSPSGCVGAPLPSSPTASMQPAQSIPRRARVARPPWASSQARPSRSPACAAAAPRAPSSDLARPRRRPRWRMGSQTPRSPPRAPRSRPGPQSGRPSHRLACAAAAPRAPSSDLALTQEALRSHNGTTSSAARAVRRFRSRVARGLGHLASAVRLSKNHRSLTHTARRHAQVMTLISGEGGWLPLPSSKL